MLFSRRFILFFAMTFLAGGFFVTCLAQDDPDGQKNSKWLTAAARRKTLQTPVGQVSWAHAPVKAALTKFTRSHNLALVIDRRMNPELTINRTCRGAAIPLILRDALGSLEAPTRMTPHPESAFALSQIGDVLYIGPAEYARKLQTVLSLQEDKIPAAAKKSWSRKSALTWPELAQPRDILQKIAKKYQVKITNLKTVPHDLWQANSLPEMTLTEQLTLILGQFGLTYAFDPKDTSGKTLEIRPLEPAEITVRQAYPANRQPRLDTVREIFPEAEISESGGKISISGPVEVHRFMQAESLKAVTLNVGGFPKDQAAEKAEAALADVRFTGKIEGPFLAIMKRLCEDNHMQLLTDQETLSAGGVSENLIIHASPVNRTLEELLRDVAGVANCTIKITGNQVRILPKAGE